MLRIFPKVRIKQIVNNPRYFLFWVMRFIFYKKTSFIYNEKYSKVKQLNEQETLQYIITNNKSIIRFGDGEFGLLSGAGIYPPDSDWSQQYSTELKEEIERLLSQKNDDILVAFPPIKDIISRSWDGNGYKVVPSMHTEARMFLWEHVSPAEKYGSCTVFLPHFSEIDWLSIREYIKDKTVVIVTGGTEKLQDIKLGKDTLFVETGKHGAFERRANILSELDKLIADKRLDPNKTLFWVSLGCTAGYVVDHLVGRGYVAWDTGHIFRFAEAQIKSELV